MPVPGFRLIVTRAVRWLNSKVGLPNCTVLSMAAMKSLAAKAFCVLWSCFTTTEGMVVRRLSPSSLQGHHALTVMSSRLVHQNGSFSRESVAVFFSVSVVVTLYSFTTPPTLRATEVTPSQLPSTVARVDAGVATACRPVALIIKGYSPSGRRVSSASSSCVQAVAARSSAAAARRCRYQV